MIGRHKGSYCQNQLRMPWKPVRRPEYERRFVGVGPDAGRLKRRPPRSEQAGGVRAVAEDNLLVGAHRMLKLLEGNRLDEHAECPLVVGPADGTRGTGVRDEEGKRDL